MTYDTETVKKTIGQMSDEELLRRLHLNMFSDEHRAFAENEATARNLVADKTEIEQTERVESESRLTMKKILVTAGSILALLIAITFGKIIGRTAVDQTTKPDIDKVLSQAASQVNATLPMMIDKDTRIDTTVGGPGKKFTYFYTFPEYASTEFDAGQLHTQLSSTVPNSVCGSADMRPMLKLGVTIVYVYRGSDGAEITRLIVTPQSCGHAP